jgi:hypothetical protein
MEQKSVMRFTVPLVDWTEDLWNSIDLLVKRFGEDDGCQSIHTRSVMHGADRDV